jgi:hypothetical protein
LASQSYEVTRESETRRCGVEECVAGAGDRLRQIIEVTSSRLTERSVVDADAEAVRRDIQKVVIEKIEQLGGAIRDLRDGLASLPGIVIEDIERIWPIVVSSEGLFQTPTLWAYITDAVEASLVQPTVQPLNLLDMEDLEDLMGSSPPVSASFRSCARRRQNSGASSSLRHGSAELRDTQTQARSRMSRPTRHSTRSRASSSAAHQGPTIKQFHRKRMSIGMPQHARRCPLVSKSLVVGDRSV